MHGVTSVSTRCRRIDRAAWTTPPEGRIAMAAMRTAASLLRKTIRILIEQQPR